MREIRQSGSEGGGNEQTVSPYPYPSYLHHFYLLPSIPRLYVTLAEKRGSILILPFTSH